MPKFAEANAAIRLFLKARLRTHYVDVYSSMLNRDGRPKPDIFGKDSLHMNAKGYSIWQKKLRKKL
jgi:lysophospholipase L1-like esterase